MVKPLITVWEGLGLAKNKPANSEIDIPIISADYYFLKTLPRKKKARITFFPASHLQL